MKALITGASSGIGKDIAKELAKRGYDLVLVARNTERLNQVKEDIEKNSKVKIEIVSKDISLDENCIELFNEFKNIDILINNAGFGGYGEFDESDLDKELQMIKTNIVAYHVLTKFYLKEMKKTNKGKILNVASIAGFMPGPLMATYYSTKAYVVRLSQAIREELRRDKSKVKISILCPGPVDTNFNSVANVKFAIKGRTSEFVAKYTVKKLLKGKFYIFPGIEIKLGIFFAKIIPHKLIAKITYILQKQKA